MSWVQVSGRSWEMNDREGGNVLPGLSVLPTQRSKVYHREDAIGEVGF